MRIRNKSFTGHISFFVMMGVVTFLMMSPVAVVSADFQTEEGARDELALRIIYSGGIKGNIKPCG